MIGTGIFLKTAGMTQELGSVFWVIMAWAAAGVLSLLGAMSYAELGALFPEAGGGYVYIREAYGRLAGFLAGWVSFWIVFPGSIAAYAVASSTFISGALPTQNYNAFISIALISLFASINCLAISFGGLIQSILTGIKVFLVVVLGAMIFIFTKNPQTLDLGHTSLTSTLSFGAFGVATLSALWAFDGWEAVARVGGEIRNAQRNLPWALVIGTFIVFGLYAFLNLAYFWALPLNEIATANSTNFPNALPVATKAILSFFGSTGVQILSAVFLISTLGGMNACIMTSARIPYAMAKDGLFFSALKKVSPRTHVPVRAIWLQALVAIGFALSGTFDQLTNYVVFSAWIFYGLTGMTVFVFRKKWPERQRFFKVPGYPIVPGLFVIMAFILLITTVVQSPIESAIGLIMILAGVPVYWLLYRESK